jgi:hypothetical protein
VGSVLVLEKPVGTIRLRDLIEHFGGRLDPRHVAWMMSELLNVAAYFVVWLAGPPARLRCGPRLNPPDARGGARLIDIAPDREGRGDAAKPIEYFGIADIAAMYDDLRAAQRIKRLRPDQAMGIGNDADEKVAVRSDNQAMLLRPEVFGPKQWSTRCRARPQHYPSSQPPQPGR